MTNKEILTINKGLQDLNKLKPILNIKTNYNLAKIKQTLTPLVNIIQEKQIELYKKYGEEKDNSITVPKEKIPELDKELNELLNIENNVQLTKIKLDDFGSAELTLEIIEALLPIIIEE